MNELRRRTIRPLLQTRRSSPDDVNFPATYRTWHISPWTFLLYIFLFITLLLSLGIYFNDRLPVVSNSDENSHNFSAHNTLKYLKELSDIGPKVTGSYENEVLAVNHISNLISSIMKISSPLHNVTYDLQKSSGNFSLAFLNKHVELVYSNVQNIIVKIGPKPISEKSLLVNCHFDSVLESPGASDDILNCAVMLEILRVLAISNEPLPHNVIFLFNGAEENPLLASHGFITKHKWAREVKAFINLESCGAGGPEVLFQAGPMHPWLIKCYAKAAKHPSGLVVAEELFQSGLIPSDTDFRIFRDYGGKPGLDFAHCKNGYVYHTKFDNIESIVDVLSVVQHTGDNIFSLIKTILSSKEFENPENFKDGKPVYYDLFGLFFVNYSADFGKAINSVAVILAIAGYYMTAYHSHHWPILRSFCPLSSTTMYGTVVISFIYNLFLAYFLNKLGGTMSWYSKSLVIVPLYCIPTLILMLINIIHYERYDKSKSDTNLKLKSQCLSVLLFWTTLLFLSTFFNVRSSYLLMVLVLLPATFTLLTSFLWPSSNKLSWFITFIASTLPASAYLVYLAISSFRLFIPITGRFGVEKNSEIIISVLATIFSAATFSYASCLILAVKRRWFVINVLTVLHTFTLIAIFFLPFFFPFTSETPQRIQLNHVNRQFFDSGSILKHSDSMFWVQNMDSRGKSVLRLLDNVPNIEQFCEKNGHCGLPWFSKFREGSSTSCILSAPHTIPDETFLELNKKAIISDASVRMAFKVSGPDHIGLILTPLNGVTLKNWSFGGIVQKRNSYIISYTRGLHQPGWNFDIELMIPGTGGNLSKPVIQVEIYGLYFHHRNKFSETYENFLLKFPSWSHVSASLSTYKSYIY